MMRAVGHALAVLFALVAMLGTASAAGPTAAGNRQAALAEAGRLIAVTPVPPGAVAVSGQPAALRGSSPVAGTPVVSSLVTRTAYWTTPSRPADVLTWLKFHPPHHLRQGESPVSRGPHQPTYAGYSWDAASSAAWAQASLGVGVVADGTGSAIRADAAVVWLDPVPARDDAKGRRLHVTVSGGCPRTGSYVGVRNTGTDLRTLLLPAATPTAGLVCGYQPRLGPQSAARARHLTAAQARSVAAALRAFPLAHVDGGVSACPNDSETYTVVALRYPHRPDVDLWIHDTGCASVANGFISTAAGVLPQLVR
jgi:hypothetical protein